MSSWTTLPNYSVGQPLSVSKMDQTMDNFIVAGCHGHTGAAGDGAVISGSMLRGSSGIQEVYQYITIPTLLPACTSVPAGAGVDTLAINGVTFNFGNSSASSGSILFLESLGTGTWTVGWIYHTNSAAGIVSASLAGASLSTSFDCYTGGVVRNNIGNFGNVSISASGEYFIILKVTGKNPTSTGYNAYVSHIELRRLSA